MPTDTADIAVFDVLDLLAALVDKSLVVFEEGANGEARYRLLESVRHYAAGLLIEHDALDAIHALREKHANYFLRFAHEAVPHLQSRDQAAYLDLVGEEMGNLRAALTWLSHSRAPDGLQLAADLTGFWNTRALLSEGRAQFADLLTLPEAQVTLPLQPNTENAARTRAQAANGAGTLALLQADYGEAARLYGEALTLFSALGDTGNGTTEDTQGQSDALHGLANIAHYEMRYDDARDLWGKSLHLREASGDTRRLASSLHSLGNLAMREGRNDDAQSLMTRALALRRTLGEPQAIAGTLGALGQLAFAKGDWARGRRYAVEALGIFHELGVGWAVALSLSDMARACEEAEHGADAARLLSASWRLRETIGFPFPPAEQETASDRKAELQTLLGQPAFSAAWTQGQTDTTDEAVAFALQTAQSV